jgi:type I restriction enzyme R subunit/putative DNA methylase
MQWIQSSEPNPGLDRVRHALRATGVKPDAANPLRSGVHSRGYLPHVKREGAAYFVTFRLAGALPKEVLLKFEAEQAEKLRHLDLAAKKGWAVHESEEDVRRDFRRKIERCLDKGHGDCHLHRPDVAELVSGALLHFDGQRYRLDDWVVMPNHVHAVLWPMPNHLLTEILKTWKQFTSRRAKPLVGLGEEDFWQRKSYDHWIRNDEEKVRIRRYVRNNPVTAKLCERPEDWQWSSAWPGWRKTSETRQTP